MYAQGSLVGKSMYLCDMYLFVPKYAVFGADGQKWYSVRPDVCVAGCCIKCRCGGRGAKCCR